MSTPAPLFDLDIDEKEVERLLREAERRTQTSPAVTAGAVRKLLIIDFRPLRMGVMLYAFVIRGREVEPRVLSFTNIFAQGNIVNEILDIIKRGKCVFAEASIFGNAVWQILSYREVEFDLVLVNGKPKLMVKPDDVAKLLPPDLPRQIFKPGEITREPGAGTRLVIRSRESDGTENKTDYVIPRTRSAKCSLVHTFVDEVRKVEGLEGEPVKIPVVVAFINNSNFVAGIHFIPVRREHAELLREVIRRELEVEETAEATESGNGGTAIVETESGNGISSEEASEETSESSSSEETSETQEGATHEHEHEEANAGTSVVENASAGVAMASSPSESQEVNVVLPEQLERVLSKFLTEAGLDRKLEELGILPRKTAELIIQKVLTGGDDLFKKLAVSCKDVDSYTDALKCVIEHSDLSKVTKRIILSRLEQVRDKVEQLFAS